MLLKATTTGVSGMKTLLSMKDLVEETTLSKTTIIRMIRRGEFPEGHLITRRRRVWKREDIEAQIEKMVDGAAA
jgi:predicted DNA-binding transcriptional regulator AlpA